MGMGGPRITLICGPPIRRQCTLPIRQGPYKHIWVRTAFAPYRRPVLGTNSSRKRKVRGPSGLVHGGLEAAAQG